MTDAQPSSHALDPVVCSRACDARDSRFDGVFFVAITTTRIYCRPVCPARVSHRDRRRFYETAAEAEGAGFRPCLRCRPELAPGRSAIDAVPRLAATAARRIAAGALNGRSVTDLAGELGVSERHLRRAFARELGLSPLQLAVTHRLLLAKRLLTDTSLPVTQIAFASGFQSVRRFNAMFQERYRMAPSALRRPSAERVQTKQSDSSELIRLTLGYRAPLAWDLMLECFAHDAIPGVDLVEGTRFGRTVCIGGRNGVILARDATESTSAGAGNGERSPGSAHLDVDVSLSLVPVLMPLLARLRQLFDLDAEPATIDAHLSREGLARQVARRPGVRVPGAFSGFDVAFRTMLAASLDGRRLGESVAARVVRELGAPVSRPILGLEWLVPTAQRIAEGGADTLGALGVPRSRAEQLAELAQLVATDRLQLDGGTSPSELVSALLAIDGMSESLATTIAMRATSRPDLLPLASVEPFHIARQRVDATDIARAERWKPWGSYAALHLWAAAELDGAPVPAPVDPSGEWNAQTPAQWRRPSIERAQA